MQKLICTRFAIGFKNGLASAYVLKGQLRNTNILSNTRGEQIEQHNFQEGAIQVGTMQHWY